MIPLFQDRKQAGQVLAGLLGGYTNREGVLVLALPRGGVPVAYEVARVLNLEMDIFVVRKLGVPGHEELAMGAIASGNVRVLNEEVVYGFRISAAEIEAATEREQQELGRREKMFRGERPRPEIRGRTVILVDDGLATGSTMRAAIAAIRQQDPARVVIAVPVAAPATCAEFRKEVDEIICAKTPDPFYAVGIWYEDFTQTTDTEVRELLEAAERRRPAAFRSGGALGE